MMLVVVSSNSSSSKGNSGRTEKQTVGLDWIGKGNENSLVLRLPEDRR